MKGNIIFIIIVSAIIWLSAYFETVELFWVRILGLFLGFFGFLFVFMLSDVVGDNTKSFGIDLIIIAVTMFVIWV